MFVAKSEMLSLQVMKSYRDLRDQIQSHHYILTRERGLEEKRLITKAIAQRSLNITMRAATARAPVTHKDSLQIDPDWMLGRNRLREFKDSAMAISWLMKALDLTGKR